MQDFILDLQISIISNYYEWEGSCRIDCVLPSLSLIYILPLKLEIYVPVHNFQRSLYIYMLLCAYIYIYIPVANHCLQSTSLSLSCTSSCLLTIPMFSLLTVVILRNDQISAPTHLRGAILTLSRTRSSSTSLFDNPCRDFVLSF